MNDRCDDDELGGEAESLPLDADVSRHAYCRLCRCVCRYVCVCIIARSDRRKQDAKEAG